MRRPERIVGTVLFLLLGSVGNAGAQGSERPLPDEDKGRRVAQTLCSGCHIVSSGQANAIAGVPSFAAIANHAGQTPERLAGAIILPHPPMPGIQVTNTELRDIIAYILSLKSAR